MADAGVLIGNAKFPTSAVSSAATCLVGAATTPRITLTGDNTITAFDDVTLTECWAEVTGWPILRHSATLKCPGNMDLALRPGDMIRLQSDTTTPSTVWTVADLVRRSPFAPNPGHWKAQGNGVTIDRAGLSARVALGTETTIGMANTSFFTLVRRIHYVSSAAAGSASGLYMGSSFPVISFMRGNARFAGGFLAKFKFGVADAAAVANARMMVGFFGSTTMFGNVEPSSLLNIICIGADAGEANLSIMHNDGSGTATKVSLGASFPANTQSADWYEATLQSIAGDDRVGYRVVRYNSGSHWEATGSLTTDLPAQNQLLAPMFWRNNGATALAVTLAFGSLEIETII